MLVDFDPLLFVELNSDFLRAETFAERFAPDRDEHFVGFEFQFFISFGGSRSDTAIVDLDRADLGFEMEGNALSG